MTPKERATVTVDAIMDQIMGLIHINGEPIMSVDVLNPAPALIAQAIREAEDAALERAAARCDDEAKNSVGSHCDGLNEASSICRNLKTKD